MTIQSKAIRSRSLSPGLFGGLSRYVIGSMLARMATGGSAVAIILLARTYGADGTLAGAMAACLTAPHVFGPVYGKWLDEARDPRLIIAATCLAFAGFFQLAMLGFDWNLSWLTISSLLVCGTCSSFMMGGLSTQLTSLVDDDVPSRRRAQSWDTITYGFGLTMGPLLIALLTVSHSVQFTVSVLMSLPLLAALMVLTLPKANVHPSHHEQGMPGFRQVIDIMRSSGPLKRTLLMTSGASFSVAALPVLAVYLSEAWMSSKESGAYLVTMYGVGCLCGAVLLMLKTDESRCPDFIAQCRFCSASDINLSCHKPVLYCRYGDLLVMWRGQFCVLCGDVSCTQ